MNVLTFTPAGIVTGLYSEVIDLTCLGKMQIRRATTIEFNNDHQVWQVKVHNKILHQASSRQACLDWEQQYFNKDQQYGDGIKKNNYPQDTGNI